MPCLPQVAAPRSHNRSTSTLSLGRCLPKATSELPITQYHQTTHHHLPTTTTIRALPFSLQVSSPGPVPHAQPPTDTLVESRAWTFISGCYMRHIRQRLSRKARHEGRALNWDPDDGYESAFWGCSAKVCVPVLPVPFPIAETPPCPRGGYNSDDITKVGVGGGGGLLSQEAVMTE